MADLNSLHISKIDNINIIQDGESTTSAENNEAEYSNPRGKNKRKKQNAGEETLAISFKSISDSNTSALRKLMRINKDVTLIDKFKGKFRASIASYSITDSDRNIGITMFSVTFKIKEQDKSAPQNLSSKLTSQSSALSNAVDTSMILDTANLIDSAVASVTEKVSIFEDVSNFATGALNKIGEYRGKLKGIVDSVASLIHKPAEFKNKILGIIGGFVAIYATARGAYEAAKNIKTFFRDITDSLSIFKQQEVINSNVIGNTSNIVKAAILVGLVPSISFESMDDVKEAQAVIDETLDAITDNDDLVRSVKNDISNYVQSLDLPNVVEIEVFQKPLLMLSYELYGTIDRVDQLKKLNNLIEDDNVSGIIKVFDK